MHTHTHAHTRKYARMQISLKLNNVPSRSFFTKIVHMAQCVCVSIYIYIYNMHAHTHTQTHTQICTHANLKTKQRTEQELLYQDRPHCAVLLHFLRPEKKLDELKHYILAHICSMYVCMYVCMPCIYVYEADK